MEFSYHHWRLFTPYQQMEDDSRTISEYLPNDEIHLMLLYLSLRTGPKVQKPAEKEPEKKRSDQPETLGPMKITIKPPVWGRPPFTLEVSPNDTIRDVKLKIKDMYRHPLAKQLLVFDNKRLDVDKTVSDSNIQDGDMIELAIHFAGRDEPV
jgi:hypothetical protein